MESTITSVSSFVVSKELELGNINVPPSLITRIVDNQPRDVHGLRLDSIFSKQLKRVGNLFALQLHDVFSGKEGEK